MESTEQTALKRPVQEHEEETEPGSTTLTDRRMRVKTISECSDRADDGFQMKKKYKVFNDPVHGNISIHPLCVKIIDTPQFQRLRFVSQLGAVRYVYPGATHTRFEHSIGTCYIAGEWARKLTASLPDSYKGCVEEKDILCVMIAGLCHDLGHGPFSHMYESYYLGRIKSSPHFKHEEQSVKMFEYLILANNLEGCFDEFGLTAEHIKVITDMINPSTHSSVYKGQSPAKKFLYQIVSNTSSGIDVDKWDYFARDCLHLNITNCFDYKRLMEFSAALVVDVAGEHGQPKSHSTEICFRDKEAENLYKMFELRYDLHRQAYKHKVTHIIHIMLADAMSEANGNLCITGEDWYYCDEGHPAVKRLTSRTRTMSDDFTGDGYESETREPENRFLCEKNHEARQHKRATAKTAAGCIEDMAVFTNLTDSVLSHIMQAQVSEKDGGLQASQDIIKRIHKRDLYTFFRTCPTDHTFMANEVTAKQSIAEDTNKALEKKGYNAINEKDLFISVVELDYSREAKDPVDRVPFYNKHKPNAKINMLPEQKRFRLVPAKFQQHLIYLTCRDNTLTTEQTKELKRCFKTWCKTNNYVFDS